MSSVVAHPDRSRRFDVGRISIRHRICHSVSTLASVSFSRVHLTCNSSTVIHGTHILVHLTTHELARCQIRHLPQSQPAHAAGDGAWKCSAPGSACSTILGLLLGMAHRLVLSSDRIAQLGAFVLISMTLQLRLVPSPSPSSVVHAIPATTGYSLSVVGVAAAQVIATLGRTSNGSAPFCLTSALTHYTHTHRWLLTVTRLRLAAVTPHTLTPCPSTSC